MSDAILEACPATPEELSAGAGSSLVARAECLGRAAVMEEVLGPHLDAMLRPIYEESISPHEEEKLPSLEGEFALHTISKFFERLRSILEDRFYASVSKGPEYQEFLELNEQRPELLFHTDEPLSNIKEALGTSIGVPLTVASWISGLENPNGRASPYRDVGGMTEIMGRRSFHRTLLRLTKGPNDFLGKGSDSFIEGRNRFYDLGLSVRDAFELEDGKVSGLSGAYALAAENRRKKLRLRPMEKHQGNDSSGCPVRHGFEGPDGSEGDTMSPLVLTGSEFTVAALRHAEQIPWVSYLATILR